MESELVRKEILKSEVASLFGKVTDDFPKSLIAELVRKRFGRTKEWSGGAGYEKYDDDL